MDTLEQILENHLSRCSLSVEMINDILARWGGLRPLINICSAFDGKWPINPLERNPLLQLTGAINHSARGQHAVHNFKASPGWTARFYKAIIGIWFYQEFIHVCKFIQWGGMSTLASIRRHELLLNSAASLRDCADIVKVWNIVFIRLISLPFQLGSPSIHRNVDLRTLPDRQNALRAPDISDLLITSICGPVHFPIIKRHFLFISGDLEVPYIAGADHSRYYEEDFPDNDGRLVYHGLGRALFTMNQRLANLFCLAGVGHRSGGHFSHHLHFWRSAFDQRVRAWSRGLKSPDDLFARYETCDQVVEAIIGKPLIKELLRRELHPEVLFARPFGPPFILQWHSEMADNLRAARKEHDHSPDHQLMPDAELDEAPISACPNKDDVEDSWYKTYHRSQQMLKVQNGISDDSVPVCYHVGP
jgi:hypothetical protein